MASLLPGRAPRFWVNWVLWFVFMVCLALGALFLVALQHMTGAMWSVPLRRLAERMAVLTPWLVPVAAIALFSLCPSSSRGRSRTLRPSRRWS